MSEQRVEPRLLGITLTEYAAVQAGLGEGFVLDEVLANERIDAMRWQRAELPWVERLGQAHADDELDLLRAFEERLAGAQQRYERRIEPLQSELGSWLSFVRLLAAQEAPLTFTAEHGLTSMDVIRLHRHWSHRLQDEPRLQRTAIVLLEQEPQPVPPLEQEPRRLPEFQEREFAAYDDLVPVTPVADPVPESASPPGVAVFRPLDEIAKEGPDDAAAPLHPQAQADIVSQPNPTLMTTMAGGVQIPDVTVLPFRPGHAGGDDASDIIRVEEADTASPDLGSTQAGGMISPLAGRGALPFSKTKAVASTAGAPELPSLSVDEYASLCASCEVYPERIDENNRRFGITDAAMRDRVDADFVERLRDASVNEHFRERMADYRAWFLRQRDGDP